MSKYSSPCGKFGVINDGPYKGERCIIVDTDYSPQYPYMCLIGYWKLPVAFEKKMVDIADYM